MRRKRRLAQAAGAEGSAAGPEGPAAGGNCSVARAIMLAELSTPRTLPSGSRSAINAVARPSPQPMSSTASSPRSRNVSMSSRAHSCCAAEWAA